MEILTSMSHPARPPASTKHRPIKREMVIANKNESQSLTFIQRFPSHHLHQLVGPQRCPRQELSGMSACERRTRGLRSFPNGLGVARPRGLSPGLRAPGPRSSPGEDGGTLPSCRDGRIRKTLLRWAVGAHTRPGPQCNPQGLCLPRRARGPIDRGAPPEADRQREISPFWAARCRESPSGRSRCRAPAPRKPQTSGHSTGRASDTDAGPCLPASHRDQMLGVWKQSLAISLSA